MGIDVWFMLVEIAKIIFISTASVVLFILGSLVILFLLGMVLCTLAWLAGEKS